MDILKTLQALNACHGPSGDEQQVAQAIEKLAAPFVDEITTDTLGNLICHKRGGGKRIMFAAHMDSIGFIVTHIDEKGFLRFGRIGGLSAHEVLGTPIRFKNGVRGVVACPGKTDPKEMKEAKAMVQVGDTAVYDTAAFVSGSRIISPYLDDRIACVVLLMAMEQLKATENDLYFVFTVQEEVGIRGARTAAYGVDPDYGIAVDVTDSDDIPDAPHESWRGREPRSR